MGEESSICLFSNRCKLYKNTELNTLLPPQPNHKIQGLYKDISGIIAKKLGGVNHNLATDSNTGKTKTIYLF